MDQENGQTDNSQEEKTTTTNSLKIYSTMLSFIQRKNTN